jgi:uncharacterized protein YgiM (DUF1202 family)
MSKTYTVVKDGTELKELKTLAAAKKVADAEAAEVYCEGECVYPEAVAAPVEERHVVVEKPSQPDEGETKYRLTALMNVRKKPSMDAQILYTRAAGTEVRVLGIVNDWLHLTNDTYILYEGGKWAVKI